MRNLFLILFIVLIAVVAGVLWPARRQGGGGLETVTDVPVRKPVQREFVADPQERISLPVPVVSPAVGAGKSERVADSGGGVASRPADDPDAISGEHILSFYDKHDRDQFIALARANGVLVLDSLGTAVRLRVKDRSLLEKLLKEGPVPVKRSPNYYVRLPPDPADQPLASSANYIGFGGQALGWLGASGDNAGWGSGVTVAVLDSGVIAHPALDGVKVEHVDMLGESAGGGDLDYAMHGTAVASLIAGSSADVRGVAPGVEILSLRVTGADGAGDTFTLAKGIIEAVDRGADVINMSLGTTADSFILKSAVDYALANNVMIIASVGNDALAQVLYPAGYDGVIGVAGVDAAGRHLYFSNRGAGVDVAAPAYGLSAAGSDGGIQMFSGTSAAAAIVSGTAAWILSDLPEGSAEQAVDILLSNCNDTHEPGRDDYSGRGIINFGRITDQSKPGIYDIAVCAPYIRRGDGGSDTLVLFVQNRGTEDLRKVQMDVEIDGMVRQYDFYNVVVGSVESREFSIDPHRSGGDEGVRVFCAATIPGVEDANPRNNSVSGRILGSGN